MSTEDGERSGRPKEIEATISERCLVSEREKKDITPQRQASSVLGLYLNERITKSADIEIKKNRSTVAKS
ncbi:hypothetical protein GWI33_008391 [Rhynchophorus ferrugineus]|uniref:Uncharacterized protein n=1 Tax=Rhynchophorus ferrugineus TaxID=354439 RepID=A0A834MG00_RHYFE|nr:hypothetical protein GWI33_008391 [Rhynchophorus ferrugineus]